MFSNRSAENGHADEGKDGGQGGMQHSHCHSGVPPRPMFATVTVAVCHCGAGCLLGDIVGEWLVYGTNATINGHHLWVSFLVGMLAPGVPETPVQQYP